MILTKKWMFFFILLTSLGIFLLNNMSFNYYFVFSALFLGYISHSILDSLTPSGLRFFNPVSNKKYYKSFGILLMILWGFTVFLLFTGRMEEIFSWP
jgi:inner membrane protein